jgi:hypothetical protein
MANEEQLKLLRAGIEKWNDWRRANPEIRPDLSGADLRGMDLHEAYLRQVDFYKADLRGVDFQGADLGEALLSHVRLDNAHLYSAKLYKAVLVESSLTGTDLRGAHIYGASVWNVQLDNQSRQEGLVITRSKETTITVDGLEIAQFMYLLLNNPNIRKVIDTLTSKTVLILGRFASERKRVLDALRNQLREFDLLSIVFDFDRPIDRNLSETIKTLVGISYFVIADITNPKSSPLELQATVPDYQIPFVPIIQEGESPFAMMVDLQQKYNWVLPTKSYDSIETLMAALKPGIIDPAVEMRNRLRLIKAQEQVTENLKDYLDKSL